MQKEKSPNTKYSHKPSLETKFNNAINFINFSLTKLKTVTAEDVKSYIQGYTRVFLYKFAPFLIRDHIKKQYAQRLINAKVCLDRGQCYCGCDTPAVFFADKACYLDTLTPFNRVKIAGKKEICYSKMLNKKEYETTELS